MTVRLDLVGGPACAVANRVLDDVGNAVVLANLDHVVAVVALLEHLPEVDGQAVDLSWLGESHLVVVSGVAVVMLYSSLFSYLCSDWLIVDGAGVRTSILHELSPLCHPV